MCKVLLANRVLLVVIVLWMISGSLFAALRCPILVTRDSFDSTGCRSRGPILYNIIISIATDLALCSLPIALMWGVQTAYIQKVQIIALFGARIMYAESLANLSQHPMSLVVND